MENDRKYENIHRFLQQNPIETNESISENFKCVKCRNILINACQSRCGCRICRICVDEMIMNGIQMCPGTKEDCQIGILSDVVCDYRMDKKVSNLIVKCPVKTCSYESTLIDIVEHFRKCGKIYLKHEFVEIGCNTEDINFSMINPHFKMEFDKHNKLLIDIINNIKNEIVELKEKEKKNNKEIENLKENLKLKDEKINSINKEIKLIKDEKVIIENYIKTLENLIQTNYEKIESKIHDKLSSNEIDFQNQKINEIREKLERNNFEVKNEISKMINDEIAIIKTTKLKFEDTKYDERIFQLESYINNIRNEIFEWYVDKINERRYKNEWLLSLYFYVNMHPYKLRLCMNPNESATSNGPGLGLWLNIYDDIENHSLNWPFKANVAIKIFDRHKRKNSSIKKYCEIVRPVKNDYRCSDDFNFSYNDLENHGILQSNYLIIQCYIELK